MGADLKGCGLPRPYPCFSVKGGNEVFITAMVRDLDRDVSDLVLEYNGSRQFRDRLFVPSEKNVETLLGRARALRGKLDSSEDNAFWKSHFDSVLRGFDLAVREDTLLPYAYGHRLSAAIQSILDHESHEPGEKRRLLQEKLGEIELMLDAVLYWLRDLPSLRREQAQQSAKTLRAVLNKVEPEISAPALAAVEKHQRALEQLPPAHEVRRPLPFDEVLRDGMQVPLEFILSWYQEDLERRTAEFRELGQRIDATRSPFAVLKEDSRGYDSADDLFADAKRIIQASRQNALSYLTLPEGEHCSVGPVPEQSKVDCPTAMYAGADLWTGQLTGKMGLNTDNLTAFTRAGLWGTVAHEVYPGHHTNYVKSAAAQLPYTFKLRQSLSRSLVEGIAHRSESFMAPHYEDDLARLASAKRVMYCAARVKAEMDLNYHDTSADDVKRMYLEEMGVNEMTARMQVDAHLMYPGDGISYYTGARVMESLRQELNMDAAEFTDIIFSFGFISLSTMEQVVRLAPEEREQLRCFHA